MIRLIMALCIMATGLTGCANQLSTTAKGLLITRASIIELARAGDEQCTVGTLKQTQCDKIKTAYITSQAVYNSGSNAMLSWIATGTDTGAQLALNQLHSILGTLQAVIGVLADTGGTQ